MSNYDEPFSGWKPQSRQQQIKDSAVEALEVAKARISHLLSPSRIRDRLTQREQRIYNEDSAQAAANQDMARRNREFGPEFSRQPTIPLIKR